MIHISLTDKQAEFLDTILLNLQEVSEDSTVRKDAKSIQAKIQKEWNAQADYHE